MQINENINQESLSSIKDLQKRNIKSNICLHKFCLYFLVIINGFLITFIILYKSKLSEVNSQLNLHKNELSHYEQKLENQKRTTDKKIINVVSQTPLGYFSYIFDNCEEANMIKSLIIKKSNHKNINNINFSFLFAGYVESHNFKHTIEDLSFSSNILVLIREQENYKFGVYFENGLSYKSNSVNFDDKGCFVFSFQTKEKYDYIGNSSCFKFNEDQMIFGEDDIIINNNYFDKGGIINFPFKNFDVKKLEGNNVFTSSVGLIFVEEVEIYSVQIY